MAACTVPACGCVLVVFVALFVAGGSITNPSPVPDGVVTEGTTLTNEVENSSVSCAQVRQVYAMKCIGPTDDVPESKVNGSGLEVCSSEMTCCTRSMEVSYEEIAKKDFRNMLQSSNSFITTLLLTSANKFRDNFLEMVHVSQNNTNVLFSEVYKKMDTVAQVPVGQLYSDLSGYILGQEVNLEQRISSFFDLLFPLVFHHSINPKLKDFSDDYKECLRQTQHEIRPFGEIPSRIALQVSRSFAAARTLLQSLHLGVEVINATDHMELRQDCTKGLLKLTYCAHCQGHVMAKPCSGYCLNIARGCLSNVAELDQSWSDFVSSLERMTTRLVVSYNIEEVLSMLDTKISEAIMYAMENGPELSKKVKVACGHPRRATRDVSEPVSVGLPGRIVSVRTSENSLYVRLQQLVQRLSETKGQYANLADALCNDDTWARHEDEQCWNGQELGEYTKTIAGVGVAAQRYNPEMQQPQVDDLVAIALEAKLQKMSKELINRVTSVPQSDSYILEGSTSGDIGDDEDYERGSGSGDWGGSKPSDFNFDNSDVKNRDISIKPKANSAGVLSCSLCLVTLLPLVSWLFVAKFSSIAP